jgi:hypothetical protein
MNFRQKVLSKYSRVLGYDNIDQIKKTWHPVTDKYGGRGWSTPTVKVPHRLYHFTSITKACWIVEDGKLRKIDREHVSFTTKNNLKFASTNFISVDERGEGTGEDFSLPANARLEFDPTKFQPSTLKKLEHFYDFDPKEDEVRVPDDIPLTSLLSITIHPITERDIKSIHPFKKHPEWIHSTLAAEKDSAEKIESWCRSKNINFQSQNTEDWQ